jgi:hypothetical protein
MICPAEKGYWCVELQSSSCKKAEKAEGTWELLRKLERLGRG